MLAHKKSFIRKFPKALGLLKNEIKPIEGKIDGKKPIELPWKLQNDIVFSIIEAIFLLFFFFVFGLTVFFRFQIRNP